jgi:hypothetical protein
MHYTHDTAQTAVLTDVADLLRLLSDNSSGPSADAIALYRKSVSKRGARAVGNSLKITMLLNPTWRKHK